MPNDVPDWSLNNAFQDTFIDFQAWTGTSLLFNYDVEQFASVTFVLSGPATLVDVTVGFFDAAGVFLGQEELMSQANVLPVYMIPVNCAVISVRGIATGSQGNFRLSGTNRLIPKARLINNTYMSRELIFTGNTGAGVFIPLHQNDGLLDQTTFNGQFSFSCVAVLGTGRLWIQWISRGAGFISAPITAIAPAATYVFGTLVHPMTPITWGYVSDVAQVGNTILLNLFPQP